MTKVQNFICLLIIFIQVDRMIIVDNIFPTTNANNENKLKHNKCDCTASHSNA